MDNARFGANRWLITINRSLAFSGSMVIPTFTLFWQERGMSLGNLYLLEIIFAIVLMILEIATGRFADRYGKVLTLRLGHAAQLVALASYPFCHNFTFFLIAEVFMALGLALNSGTDEALLFQSCKVMDKENDFTSWWSFSSGGSYAFMAIGTIGGAYLGSIDLNLPFFVAGGFQVIALLLSIGMVEPPSITEARPVGKEGALFTAFKVMLFDSALIRWMAIAPAFLSAVNQTYVWMYPIMFQDYGLAIHQTGFVYALFHLVAGLSAISLGRISCDSKGMKVFFLLSLSLMASTLGLLAVTSIWACALIFPQQVIRSITGTLFNTTINQAIPDSIRATCLSIRNAVRVSLYVFSMTPWWLYLDSYGRGILFTLNVAVIALGVVLLWSFCPQIRAREQGYQ